MKYNFIFLIVSFLTFQCAIGQITADKMVHGQVTVNTISPLEGINVVNTTSKVMVVSDQYGHFSIHAKEGDILSFSAVNYEPFRKFISKKEFAVASVSVDLTPKSFELEEVIINQHSDISAESLGIIPKDQIKLTSAERKLYTATKGTDALLNYFSGRTKMLKKEENIEQKEFLMAKLAYLFEDSYYVETLKIHEEQIKGFQYYCVDDATFARSLSDKNKTMSMFLIVGLASEFNKKQANNDK